jgi:hypothetical protein
MAKLTREQGIESAIELIDGEIEALRLARETFVRMRGKSSGEVPLPTSSNPGPSQSGVGVVDDPMSIVREQEFSGMAVTQAARVFLQRIGRNEKTPVILAAIQKGGVRVGGVSPALKAARIYTAMKRHSAFVALGKNYWDLAERRPDLAQEKKQRGGLRRRKKKPGPKPGSTRRIRIAPEPEAATG